MSTREAKLAVRDTGAAFLDAVLGGQSTGEALALVGDKLSVGRSPDAGVVVQAEGVSRVHAYLVHSDEGWFIRDNDSKNGIQVNGVKVAESWLRNGDVVQIGTAVFRFREPAAAESAVGEREGAAASPSESIAGSGTTPRRKKRNLRPLLYGIAAVAIVGALVFKGNDASKPAANGDTQQEGQSEEEVASRTDLDTKIAEKRGQLDAMLAKKNSEEPDKEKKIARLEDELSKLERERVRRFRGATGVEDPTLRSAEQEMSKLDWTNSSLREAERFFRKGQKEYQAGNLHRSMESFATALTFYRGHVLADKYLRRVIAELDIDAKKHMQLGVQYFEALQYQRAIYHFQEVISLLQHRPTEPMIQESDKYIQVSRKRLQAAEMFP